MRRPSNSDPIRAMGAKIRSKTAENLSLPLARNLPINKLPTVGRPLGLDNAANLPAAHLAQLQALPARGRRRFFGGRSGDRVRPLGGKVPGENS